MPNVDEMLTQKESWPELAALANLTSQGDGSPAADAPRPTFTDFSKGWGFGLHRRRTGREAGPPRAVAPCVDAGCTGLFEFDDRI
jgi:hypothetical protein